MLDRSRRAPSLAMVGALSRALAARDAATHQHSQRVQHFAVALAFEADIADDRTLHAIDAAALLHDIGKLGIPDRLLQKAGPLTSGEYDHVKQHVLLGADLLSSVEFPGPLALIVRHHHENWDGTGYPDGLRGEDIPLGARLLSIVDCYDALTSDRPYRAALSHCCAVAMLHERRGSMYDAELVDTFLGIVQELQSGAVRERAGMSQRRARAPWQTQARVL